MASARNQNKVTAETEVVSEEKVTAETEVAVETKEEIYIPAARAGEDPNFFIGINGKNYLLPRGKKSTVPHAVAEEYRRAKRAEEKRDMTAAALLEKANEPTINL